MKNIIEYSLSKHVGREQRPDVTGPSIGSGGCGLETPFFDIKGLEKKEHEYRESGNTIFADIVHFQLNYAEHKGST